MSKKTALELSILAAAVLATGIAACIIPDRDIVVINEYPCGEEWTVSAVGAYGYNIYGDPRAIKNERDRWLAKTYCLSAARGRSSPTPPASSTSSSSTTSSPCARNAPWSLASPISTIAVAPVQRSATSVTATKRASIATRAPRPTEVMTIPVLPPRSAVKTSSTPISTSTPRSTWSRANTYADLLELVGVLLTAERTTITFERRGELIERELRRVP